MLTARLKMKTLAALGGMSIIAAFPVYQHLLHDYQRKRFEAFFNPTSEGAYQTRQALNAIGSGRFLGKGYMHGTQVRLRHFPALWTDFPFAVWAEEWGFLGSVALLAGYLVLIIWILKIAGDARDRFGATVCVGVAAMLFWHVLINIGMVSGALPVVGVTLPLVSYGGSSILSIAAALGLVMNVSVRRFSY
jgi:rod shape determining protein RodA